jgi:hypothetical protein
MTEGFFGVSWFVWAGVATVAAALFAVVQIPKATGQATGVTRVVLRWFHSMTWVLLALSFLIRGIAPDQGALADAVGLVGLGAYLVFQLVRRQAGTPSRALRRSPVRASSGDGPVE